MASFDANDRTRRYVRPWTSATEGVKVFGSKDFQEMIHLNSPLAAAAPHLMVGMHMDATAAVLSDDPNIQVLSTAGH